MVSDRLLLLAKEYECVCLCVCFKLRAHQGALSGFALGGGSVVLATRDCSSSFHTMSSRLKSSCYCRFSAEFILDLQNLKLCTKPHVELL